MTEVTTDAQRLGAGLQESSQLAEQAFQGVGQSATQMAETVGTSASQTASRAESIGSAIGKAGLAFGGFSLLADKAAADSAASAVQVQNAFQNAGLAVEDYQSQINQLGNTAVHLGFDDEDAQNALAKILTTTGNVTKAFADVKLAEDIARGSGESLAQAISQVQAAETGRYRGLRELGIQLSANASSEDALAALQSKYAGAATSYANTQAGAFDRMKVEAENALESAGAALSKFQLPILAVSSAATALGPMVGTLKELAATEQAAALAGAAMDLALGPVGIAAAAIAAGAGIYYLMTNTKEYASAADIASGATQDLNNYFLQLAGTLDPARAEEIKQFGDAFVAFVDAAAQRSDDLAGISKVQAELAANATVGAPDYLTISNLKDGYDGLTQAQLTYIDATYGVGKAQADGVVSLEEITAALAAYQANLAQLDPDQTTAVLSDVQKIFNQSTVDVDRAATGIALWEKQLADGTLTAAQFVANMDNAANSNKVFARDIGTAAAATADSTTATNTNTNAIAAQMEQYNAVNQSLNQAIDFNTANANATKAATVATADNGAAIAAQMAAYDAENQSLGQAIDFNLANTNAIKESTAATLLHQAATSGDASALATVAKEQGGVAVPANQLTDAVKQQSQALKDNEAAAQAAAQSIADYRNRLDEVHMVVNDGSNQFAKHATIAGNALDNGNRVVVGNTNAIAQQSQGVSDWATKLIGVQGTMAQIDDLQARGVINQDEYNAAQAAGTSIFAANAAIQDDILKIQTDQAPLMAKLTENQQHYMDQLAQMPADQQLVELGYMDSAESAKALADQQLLLSAVSGELGDKGVETASRMIKASAEADPVLAAMLQDMGMITIGADGTITVNTDSVKAGKSDTDVLTGAVRHLTAELEKILEILVDHDSVTLADDAVGFLSDHVGLLDGKHATVYADLQDAASASLQFISNLMDGLNGKTAFVTVYQNTVGNNLGTVAAELNGNRLGGVAGYAGGGVVIEAAEAGMEGLTFPNGGYGLAMTHGLYNVPRGTYVDTAPATKGKVGLGGMTFHGANFNFYGLTSREQVTQQINEFALGGSR